jgi:hypothetical protein
VEGDGVTVLEPTNIEDGVVPRAPLLEGVELLGRGGTAYAV